MKSRLWLLLALCSLAVAQTPARPRLVIVFVIDGLRPDLIDAEHTPNLARLSAEGAHYLNSHSVFPTVTRVNAAALATGAYPERNGLTSNTLYDPALNNGQPFNTGDAEKLMQMAAARGRLLPPQTLSEILTASGLKYVAISSGSTGQALLLNPEVSHANGILINGGFEGGKRVAYPDSVHLEIVKRFGQISDREGLKALEWTERVLREYVLTDLKPDVIFDWLTEPDGEQHANGVGSPQGMAAIAASDRNIGLTLDTLKKLGMLDSTDILVTADHGFIQHTQGVAVTQSLVAAGLKKSADSDDVMMTSDGQAVQFFVKGHDAAQIKSIVEHLQRQPWTDVLFTGSSLPGTFSMDVLYLKPKEHAADIVMTLPWTSAKNAFGVTGTQTITAAQTGPIAGSRAGHGGMGPSTVRTPLILVGPDFKRGITIRVPASNVDIPETVLALEGLTIPAQMQGRVLSEAFKNGPDPEKLAGETRVLAESVGDYRIAIQLSTVAGHTYVDKSWRIRSER